MESLLYTICSHIPRVSALPPRYDDILPPLPCSPLSTIPRDPKRNLAACSSERLMTPPPKSGGGIERREDMEE